LTRTGRFTIEIRTNKDPAHRYDNGHYFGDSFETAIEAINFQELWSQIREARSKKPDPGSWCHACVTPTSRIFSRRMVLRRRGFSSLPGDNYKVTSAITGYRTTRVSAIETRSYSGSPVDVEAFGVLFRFQPEESLSA